MKVLHLSKSDFAGGAAIAAYRIHCGHLAAGLDSRMLVMDKISQDATVISVQTTPETATAAEWDVQHFLQSVYVDGHRKPFSDTLYSLNLLAHAVAHLPEVREADILHLHWTAGFVGVREIGRLLQLGKPVVWTLHDQWAFTEGCHYDFAAGGYFPADYQNASTQLLADPLQLAARIQAYKRALFDQPNLFLASPSRWMADCAQASLIFQNRECRVIHSSCDATIFRPASKEESRKALGLQLDEFLILFSGASGREKRKGLENVIPVVEQVWKEFPEKKISLVSVGHSQPLLDQVAFPVRHLGNLSDAEAMSRVYNACDLMLHPSLEDNFPNSIIEAQLCRLHTIAYAVGGVPEIISDGRNGHLVPRGDRESLLEKTRAFVTAETLLVEKDDSHWLANDYLPGTSGAGYHEYYSSFLARATALKNSTDIDDPLTEWTSDPLLALAARKFTELHRTHGELSILHNELTQKAEEQIQKLAALRRNLQNNRTKLEQTQRNLDKVSAKLAKTRPQPRKERKGFFSKLASRFLGSS